MTSAPKQCTSTLYYLINPQITPQVRVPSTPSTLFIVKFVLYLSLCCKKDENKQDAGFAPFFKKILGLFRIDHNGLSQMTSICFNVSSFLPILYFHCQARGICCALDIQMRSFQADSRPQDQSYEIFLYDLYSATLNMKYCQ